MASTNFTQIPTPGLKQPVRIAHLTDTHLGSFASDDPKAALMRERMEDLYKKFGRDFEKHLGQLLRRAWDEQVDAVFLTGDEVDFPAPAAIKAACALNKQSPCPIFYIPGNHDWGFPGQQGTNALRAVQRPLIDSLYLDGVAAGYAGRDLGGLQVLTVDNSTYQIDAEQLAFVRERLARGGPTVVLMHIPIDQPVLRERTIAFWKQPILMGAELDEEIRRGWSVETPVPETAEFIDLLRAAPNLHGIFCGHVHFGHDEVFSRTAAQYVGVPGFEGGLRFFEFQPA